MCNTTQVAMKKRSRTGASTVETVTKRAKQIALDDEVATPRQPTSPVDVTADFDEAGVTSESSVDLEEDLEPCKTIVSPDLNLEVKLMQGAVHEMQATVDLAAARISELRALLMQYAESRARGCDYYYPARTGWGPSSGIGLTMQEVEWQRARHELYEDLKRSSQKQINRDAIRHVRQFFLSDGIKFAPKPYEFPTENDAVGLVCAALPKEYARLTVALGEELVALLPREEGTNHLTGYVNDVNTMHVTLFHTSHPDEMLPNARQRLPQDIEKLRKMAAQFQPLALVPHRVVLSPSGAIVLLFDVDENSQSDPFTVDRLREMAKHTFSPFPKRQSKTIMHTTLARLLDPDVPVDVVERIHRHCELLTERLLAERALCVVNELWFVDETHYYWASGRTTSIPLGGPSAE